MGADGLSGPIALPGAGRAENLDGVGRGGGETEPGALLRSWRRRALLTQEQLAERAGLGVRTVRRYEGGRAAGRWHDVSIPLLAGALDLDPRERALLARAAHRPLPTSVADAPAGWPVSAPAPSPGHLAAAPSPFTGRARELAGIERISDPATLAIVTIDGMAGAGKTAFVREAARRVAARYPDGAIQMDLCGYTAGTSPVDPVDVLGRILRSIGVPGDRIPAELDDRAALYRGELAGRRIRILIDNAATEAQVAPLLPATPGCLVLITSRRRLTGLDSTHALSLDLPPHADAVELFSRAAGADRLSGDSDECLAQVVRLCGRLPLALQIAATRLRSHPSWRAEHLLRRIGDPRRRLAELVAGQLSVTASFDLSYRRLSPEHRAAHAILSRHPGGEIDIDAAAALIGLPTIRAGRLIDHLLDEHLLQEPAAGRYRFHELVRCHAADRAGRDAADVDQGAAPDRVPRRAAR